MSELSQVWIFNALMAASGATQTRITARNSRNGPDRIEIRIIGGPSSLAPDRAIEQVAKKLEAAGQLDWLSPSGDFWLVDGDKLFEFGPGRTGRYEWLQGQRYIRPRYEIEKQARYTAGIVVLGFDASTWSGSASTTWETRWQLVEDGSPREGGQGRVTKVRRKYDGVLGALKILHPEQNRDRNRRYRMRRESEALRFMAGEGTPELLDENTEEYARPDLPLFVVTRFIPGPTLSEFIGRKKRLSIDEAVAIVMKLAMTLCRFHDAGTHRDIKPDNVILEDGDPQRPIIVDFGMSAHDLADEERRAFVTALDQELGNRFLRLPEYSAGRHSWDRRSDITSLTGVLFYIITGKQPRVLRDAADHAPHEALSAADQTALGQDRRWRAVKRIFGRAFQNGIDRRFQTIDELIRALQSLDGNGELPPQTAIEELRREYPLGIQLTLTGSFRGGPPSVVTAKDFAIEIAIKNNADVKVDDFQVYVLFPAEFKPVAEPRFLSESLDEVHFQVRDSHFPAEKLATDAIVSIMTLRYRIDQRLFQVTGALDKLVLFRVASGDARYTHTIPVRELSAFSDDELRALSIPLD